jgi:hypothetical protein
VVARFAIVTPLARLNTSPDLFEPPLNNLNILNIFNKKMKTTLSFLFALFFCSTLWADKGSTVVYKAKYVLKNGSSFVGYLPMSGYDISLDSTGRNKHCSDKAFQRMLIKYCSENAGQKTFNVYNYIHLVHRGQKDGVFYIGCVDKAKIMTLKASDIKYTVFLDVAYAGYDWQVYGIQEVDSSVIEVIRRRPPINYEELQMSTTEGEGMGKYACFINFNPDISSSELYRLVAELSRKLQLGGDGTKIIPPSQAALLNAKNIFIFYGYIGPC